MDCGRDLDYPLEVGICRKSAQSSDKKSFYIRENSNRPE